MVCLGLYFALVLVPKVLPSVGGTVVFFAYLISIPLVALVLAICFLSGVVGVALSRCRGAAVTPRHRARLVVPAAGIATLGGVWWVSVSVPGRLPSGSYLLEFDPAAWRSDGSSDYVPGDITVRQKMLGSVVASLDPSEGRDAIEARLGPTRDAWFECAGRGLAYLLGRQRDFIVAIDDELLLICFDDSGHFERYRIRHD